MTELELPAVETLTSSVLADGVCHAVYPSATRTLCGRPSSDHYAGARRLPTCATCWTVAAVFDRIDGSAPDHWPMVSRGAA